MTDVELLIDLQRRFEEIGDVPFPIEEGALIEKLSFTACSLTIEPISKLFPQHGDQCELHKPEEVDRVIFPANQEPALPLQPRQEAFDEPAAFVPPQTWHR